MADNSIKYIELISSFTENRKDKIKTINKNNLIKTLSTINTKTTMFEYIDSPVRKLYFDIECIADEKVNIINEFIVDFKEFIRDITTEEISDEFLKYILTFNKGSQAHKGLSYHVYFPNLAMNYLLMKTIIKYFLSKYQKYIDFIDMSIYSVSRLFRFVNQVGFSQNGNERNLNNVHLIYNTDFDGRDNEFLIGQTIVNTSIDDDKEHLLLIAEDSEEPLVRSFKLDSEQLKKEVANIKTNNHSGKGTRIIYDRQQLNRLIKIQEELLELKKSTLKTSTAESLDLSNYDLTNIKEEDKPIIDRKLYDNAVVLIEFLGNQYLVGPRLIELVKYYDEHKEYDSFRLSRQQINIMLNITKSQLGFFMNGKD